jgi:hypothetical protein
MKHLRNEDRMVWCAELQLETEEDVRGLIQWAQGPFANMAMGNYPYPSTYLMHGKSYRKCYMHYYGKSSRKCCLPLVQVVDVEITVFQLGSTCACCRPQQLG